MTSDHAAQLRLTAEAATRAVGRAGDGLPDLRAVIVLAYRIDGTDDGDMVIATNLDEDTARETLAAALGDDAWSMYSMKVRKRPAWPTDPRAPGSAE